MKKQLLKLVPLLILLLSGAVMAEDFQMRTLIDKTFVHDNSYCRLNNKTIEIEVRSFDKYTEAGDAEYGEHIFALGSGRPILLPLNHDNLGSYRLFKGKSDHCSKSLAISTAENVLTLFFLKDNRPLGDTLSVLFYNVKTASAELLETTYSTETGIIDQGKLKFQHLQKNIAPQLGKINIKGSDFIYHEKSIRPWLVMEGKDFVTDNFLTYERSEIKRHFKNQNEFERNFGWNPKSKKFLLQQYYYAINHRLKVECLAVPYKKKMDLKTHKWKCRNY